MDVSYISEIQDTISRVLNTFWKDLWHKKVNLVPKSWSNPAGNSCDAVPNSDESIVLFKRSYSYLQFFEKKLSSSRNLKTGREIGTSI